MGPLFSVPHFLFFEFLADFLSLSVLFCRLRDQQEAAPVLKGPLMDLERALREAVNDDPDKGADEQDGIICEKMFFVCYLNFILF